MALPDLLHEKFVDLDLRTRTPDTAVRKLVRLLENDAAVREPAKFAEQILDREKISPSVVENGVAFPHARTDLVDGIVIAVGRSRAGVAFKEGEERANLIFLVGVPQRLVSDYLIVIGALARLLRDDELRQRLRFAETPAEFIEIMKAGYNPLFG